MRNPRPEPVEGRPEPAGGQTGSRGDWTSHLRPLLAQMQLPPGRELEIIEELSQHLDDRYRELRASRIDDEEARRIALEELQHGGGLAPRLQALSQASLPLPIVTGASSKGTWVRTFAPPVEGKVVRGAEGLDVGDRVRVTLIHTSVERGFIDFER